jgi:hypothetical protein
MTGLMNNSHDIARQMGFINVRDILEVGLLLKQELSPREFAVEFIRHKLILHESEEDELNYWSDDFIPSVM